MRNNRFNNNVPILIFFGYILCEILFLYNISIVLDILLLAYVNFLMNIVFDRRFTLRVLPIR